ncbi:unnamed protein product [Larinioides sclopetarius]|uniref:Uncharacterized protein n=1 Tax=Larinioides sclopetarius TaxID=280406 RepID=A0AAV2AIC3_9ARAC
MIPRKKIEIKFTRRRYESKVLLYICTLKDRLFATEQTGPLDA